MAQGMKKIAKAQSLKRKRPTGKTKKGAKACPPKSNARLQHLAVKKQISKGINSNIEESLIKAMANDTHNFTIVKNALTKESTKKKKPQNLQKK